MDKLAQLLLSVVEPSPIQKSGQHCCTDSPFPILWLPQRQGTQSTAWQCAGLRLLLHLCWPFYLLLLHKWMALPFIMRACQAPRYHSTACQAPRFHSTACQAPRYHSTACQAPRYHSAGQEGGIQGTGASVCSVLGHNVVVSASPWGSCSTWL